MWLVHYAKRYHAGERVETSITEGTTNFLVNRRMNKSQQMRTSRKGADLPCSSPARNRAASIFASRRSVLMCPPGLVGTNEGATTEHECPSDRIWR